MKKISAANTKKINNSDNCSVVEYPFSEPSINGSIVTVKGRYPDSGRVVNEVCKEVVYIITGNGALVWGDETVTFTAGDSLFIDSGETYYWEGDFTSYMACSPAFYPEQHKVAKQ